MALSREFKETVKARVDRDREFRDELLTEAHEAIVRGDFDVARILLRDYVNATVGFEEVGKAIQKSPKSLMRMFGRNGNPNVKNLFGVMQYLQETAGMRFTVVSTSTTKKKKKKIVLEHVR